MDASLTLPRLVYQRAQDSADQLALISMGQGSLTWGALWQDSRRWGGWLAGRGVAAGDRVATMVPQSLEAAALWMGCCVIGAVEVAINCEFRGEWLRHALRTSAAKVVVLPARYLDQLLPVLEGSGIETVMIYDAPGAHFDAAAKVAIVTTAPTDAPLAGDGSEPQAFLHDLAAILYTSGTTGSSKAVQMPWAQLYTTAWSLGSTYERPAEQVYYFPYACHHITGRCALYCAAMNRGRSVIREAFSTSAFWDDVRSHGCTWTVLYAAPARFLMALPEQADDADNPLRSILLNPLLPEVDAIKRRFGIEVFTTYGMTETGSSFIVPPEDATTANTGCCGRPIPGYVAQLVDEHDYPVALGQSGELVLRSEQPWMITSGYQGAAEATARAWRNGWFHTGDLFRIDERGNYWYLDRSKDMIRRRGENISSVELEAAVLSHPAVAEAAAVGVSSKHGDEEVLVAVVAKAGHLVDPAQLVAYLREQVPRFAVPRYLRVVDALPRTPVTQRIQKAELRAQGITADTWDQAEAEASSASGRRR